MIYFLCAIMVQISVWKQEEDACCYLQLLLAVYAPNAIRSITIKSFFKMGHTALLLPSSEFLPDKKRSHFFGIRGIPATGGSILNVSLTISFPEITTYFKSCHAWEFGSAKCNNAPAMVVHIVCTPARIAE